MLRINSALYTAKVLANVTAISERIEASGAKTVVLDCSRAWKITTTVMHHVRDLEQDLSARGTTIYFVAVPQRDLDTARQTELGRHFEDSGRIFATVDDAIGGGAASHETGEAAGPTLW